MEGLRSCTCGNVRVTADGAIEVQFSGLLEAQRGADAVTFVCGNCGVATHRVGSDGRQVVLTDGLVDAVQSAGSVFGVRVKVMCDKASASVGQHDPKVERLLERYKAKVKDEARAKIDRAEEEARTLLAKMAALERKNKPPGAELPPLSLPNSVRRGGKRVAFADPPAAAPSATVSKSLPTAAKSPLLDSLWAMDEELDGSVVVASEEKAFPESSAAREEEEDEPDLKSSDPLLPTSRRILFGSQDAGREAAEPSAGLAMAHSLPVEVPSFRRKTATPSLEEGEEGEQGPFVRPDMLAANTWKEQVRSEWVAQTRLGRDEDLDFLVATQGSDLKPRKKTLV